MFRVAQKMMGQCEEVHDVVQDVFAAFFQKNHNGSVIEQPGAWLYRATLNKCVDCFRKNKLKEKDLILPDQQCDEENPDKMEVKTLMQRSIASLKEEERKMVTLYSEGFSYKEIAEITDIKFTSIGKMLSRALGKLKEELKRNGYEMFD